MGRIQHKGVLNTKSNKSKSIQKTRKQLRKEKRQQKKISRAMYYQKKKSKNQSEQTEISKINNDKLMKIKEKNNTEQVPSTQKRQKPKDAKEERMQKNVKKQRMTQLKQANLDEDKAIKQLEKQLKLNKRKSKSIPKSFVSDGLDCILLIIYLLLEIFIKLMLLFILYEIKKEHVYGNYS